jgi:hypothetical protein
MDQRRNWQSDFACPACGRRSRVEVSAMHCVLRCPHCRKRLVIGKNAVQTIGRGWWKRCLPGLARMAARFGRRPAPSAQASDPRKAIRSQRHWRVIIAGMVLLSAGGLAAAASRLLPLGNPSAGAADGREVEACAERFLAAWLAGDLETAQAFVAQTDIPSLRQWWAASRGGSRSPAGQMSGGRIIQIEATLEGGNRARTRLHFKVKGREQQLFHDWTNEADGWKIDFGSTHVKNGAESLF